MDRMEELNEIDFCSLLVKIILIFHSLGKSLKSGPVVSVGTGTIQIPWSFSVSW